MSIQSNIRFMLLMPALLVWLSACALSEAPTTGKPVPEKKLTTAPSLKQLTGAEKMGCVCKPNGERWSLVALALKGTTGYKTPLGEFSSLGGCIAAKTKRGRICQ